VLNLRLKLGLTFLTFALVIVIIQPSVEPIPRVLLTLAAEYYAAFTGIEVPIEFHARAWDAVWIFRIYPVYLPFGLYMMWDSLVMAAIGVALCILSRRPTIKVGD